MSLLLESWAGGPKFSLGLAYGYLRNVSAVGDWTRSLMHNRIMPTHRIICSFAVQQHLATIDKLQTRGIPLANRCSLCQNGLESHDHLFFNCDYSAAVWDRLLQWIGYPNLGYNLITILENSGATGKHCRWEHAWFQVTVAAAVYQLWGEHNARIFSNRHSSIDACVHQVKYLVCVWMFMWKTHKSYMCIVDRLST
ncbi:uncharacterized protein LOC141617719 [Silene latifolia]|uniref:uncharacterized protein LOC141617719 n=1 Tax=Silene latifolia TaxID=37657 RepID=UPI003D77782D